MKRSLREAAFSLAGLALVYLVVSLLERQLALRFVDTLPFVRDRSEQLWWASVAALVILTGLLIIAQNAYADHQEDQWRGWLKLALEIVVGFVSAFTAIVGDTPPIAPLGQVIEDHKPYSVWALLVLLAILVAAVPILRHLFNVYKWLGIREAKALLAQTDSDWDRQLSHPLLDIGRRCALPITLWPGAVQSAPAARPARRVEQPEYDDKLKELAVNHGLTAVELQRMLDVGRDGVAAVRQLLLTGEPGGGKSAQLYLLASRAAKAALAMLQPTPSAKEPPRNALLAFLRRQFSRLLFWRYEPEVSETPLLPVILDLSTWRYGKAINDWIVEETSRVYNVHREAARRWMKDGRIFALLDGLDGLDAPKLPRSPELPRVPGTSPRLDCVAAINAYLYADPTRPRSLVVCCRSDEYNEVLAAREPLMLRQAAQLGPVSPEEVLAKLSQAVQPDSVSYAEVSERLLPDFATLIPTNVQNRFKGEQKPGDAPLTESEQELLGLLPLLHTPLLLSVALYQAQNSIGTLLRTDPKEWDSVIFGNYVTQVLTARGRSAAEVEDAKTALAWLANAMILNDNARVFQLADLQRKMIPTWAEQKSYDRRVGLVDAVVRLGAAGILVGVVSAVALKVYSLHSLKIFGPDVAPVFLPIAIILATIIGGAGFVFGMALSFNPNDPIELQGTRPARLDALIIRTGGSSRQMFFIAMVIWAFVGGIGWLSGGTLQSLIEGLIVGAAVAALVSAVLGPSGGILGMRRDLQHPEAAMYTALRQALRILLFYVLIGLIAGGVIVGVIVGISAGPALTLNDVITVTLRSAEVGATAGALMLGLSVGLTLALKDGGADVIQHFVLRTVLRRSKMVPPRLARFLKQAERDTLLRRSGSGYEFIVLSARLRDYFDSQYPTAFKRVYPTLDFLLRQTPPPKRTPQPSRVLSLLRPFGDFMKMQPDADRRDRPEAASPSVATDADLLPDAPGEESPPNAEWSGAPGESV